MGGWWEKLKLIQQLAKEVPRCVSFKKPGTRGKSLGAETECVAGILKLVDSKQSQTIQKSVSDSDVAGRGAYRVKLPPIKSRFEQLNTFFDSYETTQKPAPFQLMGCKLGHSSKKLCCLSEASLHPSHQTLTQKSMNPGLSKPSQFFARRSGNATPSRLPHLPFGGENRDPKDPKDSMGTPLVLPLRKSIRRSKTLRQDLPGTVIVSLEEKLSRHLHRILKEEYRI